MSGTINISRDLWDDPAFKNEPFTQREAWVWMIAEAAWRDRERRVGRRTVKLKRGQLAHSVRFMADAWGWSKSRVQRFLDVLENRDMLRNETGTLGQIITICKYDDYQSKPNYSGTVAGHSAGQQRDSSGTNPNKVNKFNKEPKGSLARERTQKRSRLPTDWRLPKEWGEWALDQGLTDGEIRTEAAQFSDHHVAKGTSMIDWRRAWQTWVRNALKWRKQQPDIDGVQQAGAFGRLREFG